MNYSENNNNYLKAVVGLVVQAKKTLGFGAVNINQINLARKRLGLSQLSEDEAAGIRVQLRIAEHEGYLSSDREFYRPTTAGVSFLSGDSRSDWIYIPVQTYWNNRKRNLDTRVACGVLDLKNYKTRRPRAN